MNKLAPRRRSYIPENSLHSFWKDWKHVLLTLFTQVHNTRHHKHKTRWRNMWFSHRANLRCVYVLLLEIFSKSNKILCLINLFFCSLFYVSRFTEFPCFSQPKFRKYSVVSVNKYGSLHNVRQVTRRSTFAHFILSRLQGSCEVNLPFVFLYIWDNIQEVMATICV